MTEPKRRGSRTGAAERRAFGQRLKRVAQAAGYTSETLAELLGLTAGAVRTWWVGRNEPSRDMLTEYARVCGVSVAYLLTGGEEAMGPSGTLQEWRLRFAELIRQGAEPLEAIDRITGPQTTRVEGWDLTPEEREVLESSGPEMRARLEEASGGHWDDLNEEQREAVVRLVETMAKANRPPPDGDETG